MQMSAELMISRMSVQSFRCIDHVELRLHPGTTVLVGENNAGKSSILLALATALGRRRASSDDLKRARDGNVAGSATIDVFFSPPLGGDSFSDDVRQRLLSVQREPETNRDTVGVRLVLKRSSEGLLLTETRSFLQPTADGWVESPAPKFQSRTLELVEAHLLDASRDLLTEMGAQTSPWGRVLSDLRIPDLPDVEHEQLDPPVSG